MNERLGVRCCEFFKSVSECWNQSSKRKIECMNMWDILKEQSSQVF